MSTERGSTDGSGPRATTAYRRREIPEGPSVPVGDDRDRRHPVHPP
ncbi:hypothetical protein J7E98_00470 [Streptomyces sp. ISL-86]|nr:hypothetical protein [Streptomyces sp. ISL-86]